jgi:hypothetical protein
MLWTVSGGQEGAQTAVPGWTSLSTPFQGQDSPVGAQV